VLGGVRLPAEPVEQVDAGRAVQPLDVADEGPVHVEVPLAGGRVRAHDGVADRGKALLRHLPVVVRHRVPEGLGEVVDGDEPVDLRSGRVVQRVVGGVHVREEGVATVVGHRKRVEDRPH